MMLDVFKELNTNDWVRYRRSDGKKSNRITLSFGNVVYEKMGWNHGDYLNVRTDGINFEVCKTIPKKGFMLGKCGNNGDTLAIVFRPPKKLNDMFPYEAQYITNYDTGGEILKFKLDTHIFIDPDMEVPNE